MSDAIIRARPYDTKEQDGALFWELYDLLLAQVELIGQGVFIRGGVTVGSAYVGPKGKGPVFGPAVVRAYEIENQEAVFPRIVIEEAVLEEHAADARLRSSTHDAAYDRQEINKLIAESEDGVLYIDYLRASSNEFDLEFAGYLTFLQKHAELIRTGLSTEDRRVARKYKWLMKYHNQVAHEVLDPIIADQNAVGRFELELEHDPSDILSELIV
jgi:hypothetical protein